MATFVLELRCEEIPAAALPGARRQLAELFAAKLAEAGFGELPVSALSTSRRLAVGVRDLPPAQPNSRWTASRWRPVSSRASTTRT